MLKIHDLHPEMSERNAVSRASVPTPFFGFIDSKGHSRFVLRILIFVVSRLTLPLIPRSSAPSNVSLVPAIRYILSNLGEADGSQSNLLAASDLSPGMDER